MATSQIMPSYILDIRWLGADMPRFVGPFESEQEAEDFASLNVPNGLWETIELTYPYARAQSVRPMLVDAAHRETRASEPDMSEETDRG